MNKIYKEMDESNVTEFEQEWVYAQNKFNLISSMNKKDTMYLAISVNSTVIESLRFSMLQMHTSQIVFGK